MGVIMDLFELLQGIIMFIFEVLRLMIMGIYKVLRIIFIVLARVNVSISQRHNALPSCEIAA